ncbi:MAG: PepSY domain-containing protein, partial [Bacteroidia bacterium]|nr:PepSY domain-containing protein [Bacteroidia bacterium]
RPVQLLFVIMLITGIVLWWPRKKNAAKQRFTVRWNARWRRKNYDLHNVMGFYASWLAIVLALTGLVWGFQWFARGVYGIAGGEKSLIYTDAVSDTTITSSMATPAIDRVWHKMLEEYPEAQALEVHLPEFPTSSIAANANPDRSTYWQTDYRYFDQYTLEELGVDHIYGRMHEAGAADKLMRMNYDIHVGAIIGLPGKVLAFCISLLVASLPVTGFMIWWGRNKKEKKAPTLKHKKAAALADA